MNIITLDFESFYDDEFTLKKLTTEAYVRDPRFEALLVGIRDHEGDVRFISQPNIRGVLEGIDWANTAVVMHHAQFDGLILSHHYGIKPAFIFDTLSMARMVVGNHLSVALSALATHYGLQSKTIDYQSFKGKRWSQLGEIEREHLGNGCRVDVEITWRLFQKLLETFPREELEIIDTTVRMFTEPVLVGDARRFEELRDKEFLAKNEILYALGVGESDLQSTDKFCEILEREGVAIAMKHSPPSKKYPEGRWIPALAKTDQFMRDLVEDTDERVATLAQARLDVRSTIAETRAGRLHSMSTRGPLCIYLAAYGAHTTRWSGGDKVNLQNLPRSGELRSGIAAPEGFLFCAPDQSQGECRILNYLARQEDVVEKFRRGIDPYIGIATTVYGFPVTKAHPRERGTGKQLELSCGFGAGDATIQATARKGTYGPSVEISIDEAKRWKEIYRGSHAMVVKYWSYAEKMVLPWLASKNPNPLVWGPFIARDGKLYGPNGAWIDYTTLEWHEDPESGDRYWRLRTRRGYVKMYGAKLVENVVQFASRIVTSQAMIRVRAAGYRIVGMAHDDIWCLIPQDGREEEHKLFLEGCMSVTPSWMPGVPLASEAKMGKTYG